MKKALALPAVAAVVLALMFLWQRQAAKPKEDYDYASAFEAQDAASGLPLFRLADIAGHTQSELVGPLGEPYGCESSAYATRCRYAPGDTEVEFIAGKADWITVGSPGELKFEPAALARIGLVARKPDETRADELVWTGLAGLREVRVVGDGEHVEFIRIKVKS
jgi:hypothetical protein